MDRSDFVGLEFDWFGMTLCEKSVLALWTYLAVNPKWHPVPLSRADVIASLRDLSLMQLERQIAEQLRSPPLQFARDLLAGVADSVRSNPERLELGDHLERERDWIVRRKQEASLPLPLDQMSAVFRMKTKQSGGDEPPSADATGGRSPFALGRMAFFVGPMLWLASGKCCVQQDSR
jgi:hypothetical protein